MTLLIKRMLLSFTIAGILVTSFTYGSADNIINKAYNLIYRSTQVNIDALIYNGEIYVNLSDMTSIASLSAQLTSDSITLSDTTSNDALEQDEDGNLYSGASLNGLPHGLGTLYLKNGGKYEGNWAYGLYEGHGTLVLPSGDIYVGEFSKGFIHGEGKMFYPDGSYYKGSYVYGVREGFGLYYVNNDDKYTGYWKNGLRDGKGKAYIDGKYKKGIFENNLFIKNLAESSFDF